LAGGFFNYNEWWIFRLTNTFAPREKQTELADEILSAMKNLNVSLAEAEVGTGKTLAYLIPAVLTRRGHLNETRLGAVTQDGHPMPVVIATSSIALQRAVVRDYIPSLSEILMERGIIASPLTAALRKGKGNYICDRRLANFHTHANPQTKAAVAPLLRNASVDLAAVNGLTSYIKRNIRVGDGCGLDCPSHGACRYTRHMREVNRGGYDFQVVNHNLFLADIMRRAKNRRPLLPDYQSVILDEGHKFLDAARDMYGAALSLAEFNRMIKDVRGFTFAPGQSTAEIVREVLRIESKVRLLFRFLNGEVSADADDETERYTTKIRERTEKLLRALRENIDALSELLAARAVTSKFERRYKDTLRALPRISDSLTAFIRHDRLVYWLEESEYGAAAGDAELRLDILRGIPKNLGELLRRDLWNKDIPIILTSGTLSAAGSFEHIKRKIGLDLLPAKRLRESTKPSPFNHKENTLLYISENTPFPENGNPDYIASVAGEVERLALASHGHAAVLFTSYKAMDMVWERLKAKDVLYPLFRLDRGGAAEIERFKRSGDGILFASGALWEGIDIPGDILSMLIIVRLPFAVPDPVSEWERTLYPNIAEYKARVVVPEMLIKLKQGFGRLIRSMADTGCVAILDSRANEFGAYRHRILAALPLCRVTASINEVRRFIRAKKSPAYFSRATV
jgi:ATP-dependent DNA helicase DinG